MFAPLILETERLTLRFLTADDAPAVYAIYSHADVVRYLSHPAWTSSTQAEDWIRRAGEWHREESALQLGVERRGDRALVGTCTFFNLHAESRRVEIGYVLGRPFWGQGYMSEALRALIRHGFESMDLHRIEADIDPRNHASARVLERLGFRLEGTMRERWIVSGTISDTGWYGLLRKEWQGLGVRNAEPEEVGALARIWHDGWRDAHAAIVPPELARFRTRESFEARLAAALGEVRVAGPAGAPAGFSMLRGGELYQLYVAAHARGTGVAAALISDAETRLAASGVDVAWLECAIGNGRAARFYEKRGWSRTGTVISQLEIPGGHFPLEVWRYEKRLRNTADTARPTGLVIGSIVTHCLSFRETVAFWQAALGYVPRSPATDDGVVLTDPARRGPDLAFRARERPREGRGWIHLDLHAGDPRSEVDRLIGLGAKRYPWKYPPNADYVVLEDPGGNLFCVVQTRA